MSCSNFLKVFVAAIILFAASKNSFAEVPQLSQLTFLPGDNAIAPAAGDQLDPAIAKGENNYLAVWVDKRTNLKSSLLDFQSTSDIYSARLNAEGELIDTFPIVICQKEGKQTVPDVAWNGQSWLVVWLSQEPTQYYYDNKIVGIRISPQGELLDPVPILISNLDNENPISLSVGSDGENWLVVWSGSSAGQAHIRGARISSTGQVLDQGGEILVPESYYLRYNLDIAFASNRYFVVWEDLSDCRGLLVNPDLTPVTGSQIILSPSSRIDPQVASNGSGFLVTFAAYESTTYFEGIYARTVTSTGQLGPVLQLHSVYGGTAILNPHAVWDGTNWIVTWDRLKSARINNSGAVLDAGGVELANGGGDAVEAGINGGIITVFADGNYQNFLPYDIFSFSANADLVPDSPQCISLGSPSQIAAHIAGSGDNWMVIYLSLTSSNIKLLAQPINSMAQPLTASPTVIASSPPLQSPSVAWNGTHFLVTWNDKADSVYSMRIGPDGSIIGGSPMAVMPGWSSDVAAIGDDFLIVSRWKVNGGHHASFPVAVRMSGTDGSIIDAAPFTLGYGFARNVKVESASDKWFVVWERHPSHDDPMSNIFACFVESNGTSPGEFAVYEDYYSNRFKYAPEAACAPNLTFVTWHDSRISNADWNIQGSRIDNTGAVLDGNGFTVNGSPWDQQNSAVAWNGSEFLVAYEDWRAKNYFFDQRTDVYLSRVAIDGTVMDSIGISISNSSLPEYMPAIASANTATIIAASIFRDSAPYSSYRIGLRTINNSMPGDLDGNQRVNISDFNLLVNYLFRGGNAPQPYFTGDVNCNGMVNIVDLNYFVNFIFRGGPSPCS